MLEILKIGKKYDGFLFLAEAARNPPILKPHHHEELELNLVVRGEVTYVVEGRRYRFPRGSLLWLFPAQEHQLVDRTDDAQYYVAVFRPELIRRACRDPRDAELMSPALATGGICGCLLEPERFLYLRQTMDQMMEGSLDPDLLNRQAGFGIRGGFTFEHGDPDALNAGLHYLLIHCWRVYRKGEDRTLSVGLHPAVTRALEVMTGDLTLGLEEVSARCHISPAHLSRVFRQQVGIPLSRYRNSARLGKFLELFHRAPRRTLLDLVLESGFGSYAQFYKVFTENYGMSPGAFSGRYGRSGTDPETAQDSSPSSRRASVK